MPGPWSLDFNRAWGEALGHAMFRVSAEDFVVEELLDQSFSGTGEHVYVQVRKRNENTRWLAERLADQFGVPRCQIGYAGLKDRRALATQWFSVCLPGHQTLPDLSEIELSNCQILSVARHRRKLRRGTHYGNRFEIILRDLRFSPEASAGALLERLQQIKALGVPNYFGEQRFGIDAGNLVAADQHFAIRRENVSKTRGRRRQRGGIKGLYLSAARAYLFNRVLSERVADGTWRRARDGEMAPAGPLWGRGRLPVAASLADWEAGVLAPMSDWLHGLEHSGLNQERRALILEPSDLHWHLCGDVLRLEFELPRGAYATALLRELVVTHVPDGGAML